MGHQPGTKHTPAWYHASKTSQPPSKKNPCEKSVAIGVGFWYNLDRGAPDHIVANFKKFFFFNLTSTKDFFEILKFWIFGLFFFFFFFLFRHFHNLTIWNKKFLSTAILGESRISISYWRELPIGYCSRYCYRVGVLRVSLGWAKSLSWWSVSPKSKTRMPRAGRPLSLFFFEFLTTPK
jgi:hypothetical protein